MSRGERVLFVGKRVGSLSDLQLSETIGARKDLFCLLKMGEMLRVIVDGLRLSLVTLHSRSSMQICTSEIVDHDLQARLLMRFNARGGPEKLGGVCPALLQPFGWQSAICTLLAEMVFCFKARPLLMMH